MPVSFEQAAQEIIDRGEAIEIPDYVAIQLVRANPLVLGCIKNQNDKICLEAYNQNPKITGSINDYALRCRLSENYFCIFSERYYKYAQPDPLEFNAEGSSRPLCRLQKNGRKFANF